MTDEQIVKETSPYKLPLRYEPNFISIVNDKGQNVLAVRGYGAICRLSNAEEIQDEFGEAVAKCLNDNLDKYMVEVPKEGE